MPLELSIAWRYLAASRKRAHVAVVSAIALGGLAVGVAALVLSIALLTGFQDRIRERLSRDTPHLLVVPARGVSLSGAGSLEKAIAGNPEVSSVSPFVDGRGWITDPGSRSALPVRFRSSRSVAEGEVAVAAAVAGQIGTGRGGEVRLVANRTELSPLGPIPVSLSLRVAAVSNVPPSAAIPEIALSLADARTLAGEAANVSGLAVKLVSASRAEAVRSALAPRLGPDVRVRTWAESNPGLTFALRLEKILIFVTVFLIVVVASLNVVSDLALLVVEKRRDLGVLATLGAPGTSLSRIYWWLGASIGGAGTLAGAAGGAAAAWALDRFALVPLPADVYLMSHVPFALHPRDLALVVAFSLSAALAAAALPARSAGRVGPAEALRLSR
ncbi:MAG TPA: FtsX-like permease family protein [Thermoanaerobaculia bacterium]|nr:FtsX-like permease family protein [Thermoanaerobaculia bacterium]